MHRSLSINSAGSSFSTPSVDSSCSTPPSQRLTPRSCPPRLASKFGQESKGQDYQESFEESQAQSDYEEYNPRAPALTTEQIIERNRWQKRRDNFLVRRKVLAFFDAKYLAPKRSRLFNRELRKAANSDGTFTRKKNFDLDRVLFKRYIHMHHSYTHSLIIYNWSCLNS